MEADVEFEEFMAGVNRALTAQFGPDHQTVLSQTGKLISAFEWRPPDPG